MSTIANVSNTDILFYSQLAISITGLVFTGAMLIAQPQNSTIYLPIFTSLIFSWVPSPITQKNFQNQMDSLNSQVKLAQAKINELS